MPPHDYFQFKQFTVRQGDCAMKVSTDACVLGAWADVAHATRLLDLGTGTGLLALMLLQRADARATADALELDPAAARQAAANFAASPWAERLRAHLADIRTWAPPHPYDLIVSNPPFFEDHTPRPTAAANAALHSTHLRREDLLAAARRALSPDGTWAVLLPPYQSARLAESARAVGLWPFRTLHLHNHVHKPPFRVLTQYAAAPRPHTTERLVVWEAPAARPVYTKAFRALLRDYYLIF